jgi:prepilin-type N-terminal cleavage/methylation domain-containing protein
MKGARTPAGYTILEVMIVLAVSGMMFLIAANFISGKQEAASFPQGVNQLAANIQNTIEQVDNGQYSDIDFTCTFHYGDSSVNITTSPEVTRTNSMVGDTQGTQAPCIFLGKVIQFNSGVVNTQQYQTFTMAGGRLDAANQPITTLANASPTAVRPFLTIQSIVPQSLNIIDMNQEPVSKEPPLTYAFAPGTVVPNTSYYGVGFIQSLGTTAQNGAQNGAQPLNLYYVAGLAANMASPVIDKTTLTLVLPGNEIVMCVTDNTKYAYIEIGSANSQVSVSVKMLGANQCT